MQPDGGNMINSIVNAYKPCLRGLAVIYIAVLIILTVLGLPAGGGCIAYFCFDFSKAGGIGVFSAILPIWGFVIAPVVRKLSKLQDTFME